MLKGGDVEWRKLQWMPASQSVGRGTFDFGEPIGRQRMGRYPAGEQITVPRHIPTRRVRTMIIDLQLRLRTAGAGCSHPSPGPPGSRCAPLLRRALGTAISRLPEGPSEADRAAARFTIVCEAWFAGTRHAAV